MKQNFSKRAIERVLRLEGAKRVGKEAVIEIGKMVEDYARKISRKAVRNAFLDGRKVVKKEDVVC